MGNLTQNLGLSPEFTLSLCWSTRSSNGCFCFIISPTFLDILSRKDKTEQVSLHYKRKYFISFSPLWNVSLYLACCELLMLRSKDLVAKVSGVLYSIYSNLHLYRKYCSRELVFTFLDEYWQDETKSWAILDKCMS